MKKLDGATLYIRKTFDWSYNLLQKLGLRSTNQNHTLREFTNILRRPKRSSQCFCCEAQNDLNRLIIHVTKNFLSLRFTSKFTPTDEVLV